jgi:hypothetical protein
MNKPVRRTGKGVALVEMALVLIPLILLVFGITELGRALYQQNSLTKAVGIGARYLARQPALLHAADAATPCAVRDTSRWTIAQEEARRLVICGRVDSCAGLAPVVPGLAAQGVQIAAPEWRAGACVLQVSASAPFTPLLADLVVPLSNLAGFSLNARTEDRYIGE